jgi:hypothetical protein
MQPHSGVMRCLLMVAVIGSGLAVGSGRAAASKLASPLSTTVVTVYSENGDPIDGGGQQEFDPSNATITGTVGGEGIDITASGGTGGNTYHFDIAPPHGTSFAAGEYTGVQRTSLRQPGHPGLDITNLYDTCNTDTGSFEIREVAYSGKVISSLDLLYEQHCNSAVPALFGEIRFGAPVANTAFVASQSITWPDVTPDDMPADVMVTVRNLSASAVQMGTVTIAGSDPTSFIDANDQCSGALLAPITGWCYVSPGFTPTGAGPETATLRIPLGSKTDDVQLDGTTSPDDFSLAMTSHKGDYVGQGQRYLYTPDNATVTVSGGPTGLDIEVNGGVLNSWTMDLYPAAGEVLKAGLYPNATRWPFNGAGNGLNVDGESRGCNTLTGSFTVQRTVFSPVDNAPLQFAATFVQHCEGAGPALRGTISYATGATLPPPVSNLGVETSTGAARVTWKDPAAGSTYTVVRLQPAGAVDPTPFTGTAVYSGPGTEATIGGLVKGAKYLITAFTVDAHGDVGAPETLSFTGA